MCAFGPDDSKFFAAADHIFNTHLSRPTSVDLRDAASAYDALARTVEQEKDAVLRAQVVGHLVARCRNILQRDALDLADETHMNPSVLHIVAQAAFFTAGFIFREVQPGKVEVEANQQAAELCRPHTSTIFEIALYPMPGGATNSIAIQILNNLNFDWSSRHAEIWESIERGGVYPSEFERILNEDTRAQFTQMGVKRLLAVPADEIAALESGTLKNLTAAIDRLYVLYRTAGGGPELFLNQNPLSSLCNALSSGSIPEKQRALRYFALSKIPPEVHGSQDSARLVQVIAALDPKLFHVGERAFAAATVSCYRQGEAYLWRLIDERKQARTGYQSTKNLVDHAEDMQALTAALNYFYQHIERIAKGPNRDLLM